MRNISVKRTLLSLGLMSVLLLSLAVPLAGNYAFAADATPGQGLEISPPLMEINADPGQTVITHIKLRNVTQNNLTSKASKEDFVAKDEEGNPKILLEPGETSPYSLKDWIQAIGDKTIKPSQQITLTVKIIVPKDASPGGHYGVVRFTAVPEGLSDTGVALSASIGTLLLVNISGNVTQKASIKTFSVARNNKTGSFFEYGPLVFTERISNDGNSHIKPTGEVVVKNIFGHQIASLKVNDLSGNILPGSIRKFDQQLGKKWLFGRYSATMTLLYGDNNQTLKQTIKFWVIPYKFIAVVLLSLLLIFILLRFTIKRYNRRVVEKAGAEKPKVKVSPPSDNDGQQSIEQPPPTAITIAPPAATEQVDVEQDKKET